MHKKAVIFDMDGVIIDSEPLWQRAQIDSLAALGAKITILDCEQLTMGKRIDEIARIWRDTYSLDILLVDLESMILSKLCRSIAQTGKAMLGVYDALAYFSQQNFKIALATSSSHVVINTVFDRLELWDKFSVICSAEDEIHGKPYPDVYLSAIKALGVAPAECLVIEDSLTGLVAAKRAGIMTLLVSPCCHDNKFDQADARFNTLESMMKFYDNQFLALS